MAINHEQEKVIGKLEEVIKFFRGTQIKNEDSLFIISEQLDTLMSSLKYLPSEPPFDSLPPEIKTDILSYLCDSGAFVAASVSREWKEILQKRLKQLDQVNIGKHCVKCEDAACFMPEETLKASVTLDLDVPLSVCHPLPDVDTELVVKGLTSVSNLTIEDVYDDYGYPIAPLKTHQKEFIRTLLQDSPDSKLKCLTLTSFEHPADMSLDFADAVCKVENVNLGILSSMREVEIAMRLFENIQEQNIKMKTLKLSELMDWGGLVSPEELKAVLNKMDGLDLVGYFTPAQVEAAKSLPGIDAGFRRISKRSI